MPQYQLMPLNVFTLSGPTKATNGSAMETSLSPIDLFSVDKKTDDGKPLTGKIVNDTQDPTTALLTLWGATASSAVCTFGGAAATNTTQTYNASSSTGGNSITCQPIFIW
jgi:hypothetical protein